MRKFAGKCLALLLALLMPLTSMPISLAESYTSEPFDYQAEEFDAAAAKLAAIDAAVEENAAEGAYVQVYSARVQGDPAPIATGEEFNYEIGFMLNPAPRYIDATGEPQPAYTQYEDVEITFTVPEGIVVLDADGEHRNPATYTISLGDLSIPAGALSRSVTVRARIDKNGDVEDGTGFAPLGNVTITANVSVEGVTSGEQVTTETRTFTYTLPDARNQSAVTSAASGDWMVTKDQPEISVGTDEVTITWEITAGKDVNGAITGNTLDYNAYGALKFESFTLTDTLPTITGKDGNTYLPKSSSLSATGMEKVTGGAGETTLSTHYYATTALTAGGVDTTIPYRTVYTVTATYDKAAFVLPFEEEEVTYTNEVEMTYKLVGEEAETKTASVDGAYGIPTAGGTITVFEKLQLGTNGSVVDYTPFYKTLFPNGAKFDVYSEADWNNGAPAEDAKPAATLTVGTEAGATTAELAPGTYYVVQTSAPTGTEMPANEGTFQTVPVPIGDNVTLTFTNPVKDKGILEIDKVDAGGQPLPGAAFTLTASDGETTYPLGLDSNGHGVIVLPAGTYTLSETTVPDGYVKMADKTITISEGQTNKTYTKENNNALVNYSDKGTLTITKQIADGTDAGATAKTPSQAGVSEDFTFNIYSSTTGADFTISGGDLAETVPIAAGASTVTVDLPVRDESGKLYYYKVVEVKGSNASLDYDTKEVSFNFGGENGAYTTAASATFTNILKSKLVFQKNEQTLNGTTSKDGVQFEIWAGEPNAEGSEKKATVETANGGVGATDPLPIRDESGAIDYYIVEVADQAATEGYTVKYPDGRDYYGPINLSFAATTDVKAKPIVNQKDETQLTVQKTDTAGKALAGATFTVQDKEGRYAAIVDGKVTWSDTKTELTTGENDQIVLSAIPNGTYTVTETGVPDGYLSTGTVSGADEGIATTEGALSGKVTLGTLEKKTITFANEKKPALTFTKKVEGNVSGEFTFELYKANADGTAPEGSSLGSQTVTNGQSATFTVDAAGQYFLKETAWPVGVIAPNLIHTQSGTGVYVDATGVYYGPYTLENDKTDTQTITNTPNTGSLTITKTDSKTDEPLHGAKFALSVAETGLSNDAKTLLTAFGFKVENGDYTYEHATGTNANGSLTIPGLPVYDGTTPISYTVTETQAPTGYLLNETAKPDIMLNRQTDGTYSNSVAFTNDPVATITITKEYYKQWDKDSNPDTYHTYKLANAELAIFEEGEDGYLKQVDGTSVQTTGANGQTTFTGLNGTKTYYVFELSNANRLVSEDGRKLGVSVSNIGGETPEAALKEYYGVSINLNSAEVLNNAGSATLTNVEKYVQFTLDKYYIEEEQKFNPDGTPVLDKDGNKVWVDKNEEHIPLDRAKFVLCRTTAADLSGAGISAGTTYSKDEWIDALDGYLVSEYIYESGISTSEGAGPGRVVTGNLPASDESGTPYNYFLVEVESPVGFAAPVWPSNVGPLQDGVPAAMEDHPLHDPGDPIRYVQVKLDKVARDKDLDEKNDASKDTKLANATFALYILGSDGSSRRLSTFTTGVDIPGTGYDAGRGVSESIEMRSLYYELGTDYVTPVYAEDGETILEYTATFQVVEIGYPDYTTPKEPSHTFKLTTNGRYDTITEGNLGEGQSADETMWDLTQQHGKFVNVISDGVTVTLLKYGYSAETPYTAENPGWALDGAEITIYKDVNNNGTLDAADRDAGSQTGVTVNGRVSFIVDPQARYFYEETEVPEGYESTADCSGEFTAPPRNNDPEAEQGENIVAKLHNVLYRKVTLTKVDSEDDPVAATFQINQNGAPVKVWLMNDGELVESTLDTVATGADGKAEFYLPTGTYTVSETHVGGVELSKAEKDYFSIINDNTTFIIAATDTVKELDFENPGRGGFTLTKTDDEDAVMSGVSFKLQFKQFTAADYASATTTADTGFGDLAVRAGATANDEALVATGDVIVTTNKDGEIDFEGLLPGWYKLIEQETAVNEDYELSDDDTIVKVTATNFGANGSTEVTVINTRKGYLNVSKAYEGVTGFEDQTVTFDVYSDKNCTSKVGSFTVTGEGMATATVAEASEGIGISDDNTTLTLDSGTYYVKESTSGDWYTKYALTEDATDFTWLGGNNSAAAVVGVTPGNTATVYFTNVGNIAGLTFDKVDDGEPAQPVAGATFALYYGEGDAAKFYNKNGTWGAQSSATSYASGEDGKVAIADIKLPYDVVTASDDMSGTFYIKELSAPDNYYADLETATPVTLEPGVHNTDLTGENAIVNEKGVVITLTKYNKPYAVTEDRKTLDGAEFTLYRMSASGSVEETFPAQPTKNGQVQFVNLPQLKEGEYYAIQETVTPTGYLQDSLELYDVTSGTDAQITADDNGYFRVATDEDVTLEAYNTPLGKIAILKYDYINTGEKPVGATFTATNDEDDTTLYKGTLRLANGSDEQTLAGGYRLTGDHYVKDGVSYTIAYLTGVAPGTYTVVENTKPTGYLYTPDSEPGDPWHTTQTVPVENDGSTAVVVFANLPDPEDFTVNIDKSAEYLGEGDLLGEEYQTVKFTLSNFTSGTELPLETAVLKDETFTFTDENGKAVTGVEWYVESVTIGAAHYEDTAYAESASNETIYATVKVKDASGRWSEHGTYALDSAKTITFGANACQGIEIVYGNADGKLDAGFTAGEVVLTVKARQPVDNENTVPVAKIGNTASISMTYDFGIIGAQAESGTKTKSDSASAEVIIDEAPALPQVSITKTSQVQALDGTPIEGETVSPGERLAYTITLTGVSGEMENPVLADILPAGLDVVANGLNATTTAANLTVVEVQQAGQNIWVTTSGKLAAGEKLTLTILVDVLPTALIGGTELNNTAYVFNNTTVPKNANNPHGSSFADEGENGGELPAVDVPEAFASAASGGSGKALKAEAKNTVASASGITIAKMVSLDNVNWVSNEELLVAEKGDNIYYRVTVTNNGTRDITKLRILDVLPHAGDGRSAWGPTLTSDGVSSNVQNTIIYYTNEPPSESTDFTDGIGTTTSYFEGANAFLAVVEKLEQGKSVTLTYTTQAPVTPDDKAYYQLAINTASCMFAEGSTTPLSSADTKVTITPEAVSLGDRVWVDENANGIQDGNETKVPGGTTTFTLYPYMEDDPQEQMHTTANAEGKYKFTGLTPAAPQGGTAEYFDSGDVNYASLMGSARATYQLSVQVPDGYRITTPSKTEVESRSNSDSDFALTGETIKFYIPAGGMDDTYDVGVIRERDLTITKKGTDGRYLAGAEFAIYGPYFEEPDAISGSPIATITTGANGRGTFESSEAVYLNAYAYYVIVETRAPEHYSAKGITVTSDGSPVETGTGLNEDGNYFVLKPYTGTNMTGVVADTVTVTNTYEATGVLSIQGTKTFTGGQLVGEDFTFTLASEDHPNFTAQEAKNSASGTFAFTAIEYDYDDLLYLRDKSDHAYHYRVSEVNGGEEGVVYDSTVYNIAVTLTDNGDGTLTANAAVEGAGTTANSVSLSFANAAQGSLSVSKTAEGNGADTNQQFSFTLQLANTASGVTLEGEYPATINGAAVDPIAVDAAGKATFTLTGGQTLTIGGIPSGTAYTVTEDDYRKEGYITTSVGASGAIATGGTTAARFTNTRSVGGLTVKKTLGGNAADAQKDFTFTVTLQNATLPLDNDYGVQFTQAALEAGEAGYKATATFTLKGGETQVLTGIPAGTEYTVEEDDYTAEGYVTDTPTNATGEITHGGNPTVTFKNTRKVGGLTVSKTVTGNDFDANKAFDITVTLTAPANVNLAGSYTGAANGNINVAATPTGAIWTETFSLKNGKSIEFTGLPENTAYTVSEADYAAEGYAKTVSGTEKGSIKAEATATVAYTNTRDTGDLVITKTVTGSGGEEDKLFDFTVTLKNATVDLNKTFGDVTFSPVTEGDAHEVQATFSLKHGESKNITGIPVGTTYTVTEADYTADGYVTTAKVDDGAETPTREVTGTIEVVEGTTERPTFTAAFTNTRNVGGLTVTKKTVGNGLDEPGVRDTYEITVTLTPKTGVDLVGTVNGVALPADGTVTEGVWRKTFTLAADESVTFTGLPEDTVYTVSEEDYTAQGFITTIMPQTGTIEVEDGATEAPTVDVTVTNTRNVGGLTIAKIVTGTGSSANDTFTFRLELENDRVNVDGEYTMTYSDVEQPVLLGVNDGEAEITLHGGQTAFIAGIPLGTTCTVTELASNGADAVMGTTDANGYTLVTANGLTNTIANSDGSYQAAFTNERNVGSLTITKQVEGNGEDAPNALTEFEVTVTLTAPTGVELVGTWKQGETSGKVASSNTFTLTDGESVELTGLPEGTSYTITEADYAANGYDSDIEPEKGEITDGASSVTVTNRLNVGDLSVLKTVAGSGAETEREFSFTLTLTNEAGVTVDNTYKTSKGTLTVTGGKATFTLKGGETLTIYGIPEGTDYTVAETDPAEHGYLITSTSGEEGTIGTGMSSATFTNTRDIGELSIEKKVDGAIGDTDKAFDFTLTLTPSGNGIGVDGTYDATLYTAGQEAGTTVTVANGTAKFSLTHDQRLVIHEIPAGVAYEVAEESYALEGYETSASGETGTIPATGSMPVATFTNTRDGGSLRIVKNFAGNAQIPGDTFAFTIRLGRDDGVDVNGTYNALRNGVAEQITFTGGVATVWLTGGDTFEILGILSGTNYAVSEDIPASSGYMGFGENETGAIPIDTAAQVTYTNARYTGNLTVRKTVAGNAAETDRSFRFTIFLRNPDGTNANGTYPMTGRSAFITFVNGYASISLAAGETATVHGILSGAYYSVSEDDANTGGYVTTASGAAGIIPQVSSAVASFLNTRDVGTEETTTSRTVYKVWNDEGNADGLRPTELVVYLLADGVSIDAATLNEANGWSARFDNLPVYNADGSQIEYQVVEAYTAEYYVRYQYAAAVINIINSHSPEEFVPDEPRDPNLLTLIEDYMVPLGGNVNMNEGDCFN